MRQFLTTLSCICTVLVHGQQLAPKDSLEIVSIINAWNDAWNSKDYQLASKWYSDDARFTNAFGDTKDGRGQIEQLLKEVFALPFVMTGNSSSRQQLFQVLSGDIVLVHTLVERDGQKMPDGTSMEVRNTTHLRVFKRVLNKWQIRAHLISDARSKNAPKH